MNGPAASREPTPCDAAPGSHHADNTPISTHTKILLDLGNILFHVRFDDALKHWAAAAAVPAAALAQRFELDAAYAAHETGDLSWRDYCAHLGRQLRIELDPGDWRAGWQAVVGDGIDGVEQRLRHLADRHTISAFSNTNFTHLEHMRARHAGALALFSKVFTSCELGARKPEPEAFRAVVTQLGVEPQQVLFVDDTPANVHGARAAGLTAIHAADPAAVRGVLDGLLGP